MGQGSLHKTCPYSKLSPYLVGMRENTDQNNPEYGNISRSGQWICVYFSAFYFQVETYIQEKFFIQNYNLGQNVCRLFHILTQFPLTKGKAELDYYHQKVNIRVASRVTERLKTQDLGNQEISRKLLKCLELKASTQVAILKENF